MPWCLVGEKWLDVFYVQGGLVLSNVQILQLSGVREGINFLL